MNNLYNFFENAFNEDKIVQSYLIGNTKYDEIKEELFKVFSDFFFKSNSNLEENPDLYIFAKDGGNVSKDEIKELIKDINTTSQFNNVKVYVIDESENLNDFAFNAILKTLEEPAPNVYAFLITKNIDSVRPTIASRCQKIFISSEVNDEVEDEEINIISEEFLNLVEKENIKTISRHPEIYTKLADRDVFKKVLMCIQKKYIEELDNLIYNNIGDVDIDALSKKILVVNNNINLMNNNMNKNLSIDRFIIEMWRCNNENS